MKIYTKTGDYGTTSLANGDRILKSDIRVETYGAVDELNAWIGQVSDSMIKKLYAQQLQAIQSQLFVVGATLASNNNAISAMDPLGFEDVEALEKQMDFMNESLPKMTHFILPGGHTLVSQLHIARCVCRRAERWVVRLNESEEVDPIIIVYLNRLSDYLFVLSRKVGHELQIEEHKWIPKS